MDTSNTRKIETSIKRERTDETNVAKTSSMPPPPSREPKKRRIDEPLQILAIKMIRPSEYIGKCPSHITQMIYDVKNKEPMLLQINIKIYGHILFNIFKYAEDNKIPFEFIDDDVHIIMYGYRFSENQFEHQLNICDNEIGQEALRECERKKLNPYNDPSKEDVKPKTSIHEYPCLHKNVSKTIVFDNDMIKTIELNVMNIHFIQNIINVMKKNNEMIELEGFAHIKDIYESNMTESLIGSITDQILS